MKRSIIAVAVSQLICANAWANCPPDQSGLGPNAFADFETRLPAGYVQAPGARTADDFSNAVANELFFTEEGWKFVRDVIWEFTHPFFGPINGDMGIPIVIHGHACNDIGQCANVDVTVHFGGSESLPAVDGLLSFLTAGLIEAVPLAPIVDRFTIQTGGDGGNVGTGGFNGNPIDYAPESIEGKARQRDPYRMSTEGQTVDTRCRDNDGNLTGENSDGSSGGGGSGDVGLDDTEWDWEWDVPFPRMGWICWETATGVACREVSLPQ